MKLIVEVNGKNVAVESVGELIKLCSEHCNDTFDTLWWRDDESATDTNVYGFRDFTQKELQKAIDERGEITLQFGRSDKSGDGEIFFVYSESGYAAEQADIIESMTDMAQTKANQSGKEITVHNLMGKSVTKKPQGGN